MRTLFRLVAWSLFFPTIAFANQNVVNCTSVRQVAGWTGSSTFDKVRFSAVVKDNRTLQNAKIAGAFESAPGNLAADQSFVPRLPMYQGFNRFNSLEDAWCWFTPLLPNNVGEILPNTRFTGFVQMVCEEGRNRQTVRLVCSKRNQ
jgi:hypothetical protein